MKAMEVVRDFEIGDEVYGMNDWFVDGATAEFCITLFQNIARKHTTLSHEAAASVPIGALTSWQGLTDRATLEPDERVLVHGGAGAVGVYAVQLAHIRGTRVITSVSAEDPDFVKRLGADQVIDYKASGSENEVRDVDVVFDAVGGDTLERSWGVLKPGGCTITIAAHKLFIVGRGFGISPSFFQGPMGMTQIWPHPAFSATIKGCSGASNPLRFNFSDWLRGGQI